MVGLAITIFSFVSTIISPFVRYCNFFSLFYCCHWSYFSPACRLVSSCSFLCHRISAHDPYVYVLHIWIVFACRLWLKRKLFPSTYIDFPITVRCVCVCVHCVRRWWWLFTFHLVMRPLLKQNSPIRRALMNSLKLCITKCVDVAVVPVLLLPLFNSLHLSLLTRIKSITNEMHALVYLKS